TLFTGPKRAIHYFCVTDSGVAADNGNVGVYEDAERPRTDGDGDGGGMAGHHHRHRRLKRGEDVEHLETIAKIKEQWSYDQSQQEEMQKILADGAAKHEITNWLKRSGWTAHFINRNLREIYLCSRLPGPEDDRLRRLLAAVDRMFFDRCIGGLKSMPLMARLLLASPHPKDAHSRPFGPLQEKTSMDRYLAYWKRFLCYCLNVLPLESDTLLEKHGFSFTSDRRRGLETLWEHLQDGNWPERDLEEELLQVSASFWMQRLDGDPFASPLWHFVAVLGIDGESGQLRPAHLFTYVLAGMVYVGRALLAEYAVPTAQRPGMEGLERRFARVRDTWLCKATYSPMGYMLSLLLYGRKIARETGSRLMVSWSKQGDLMYFMGKPIPMDAIRAMIDEMITDAETLLWTELMFKEERGGGDDVRFTIPLADVEDHLTQTQRGQSFVHTNGGLAGKEGEMLEDLVRGKRRQEFLNKDGRWNWEAIRGYLKSVDRFKELFLLSAHMAGGAPARGDEIGGLRWVNGINRDRGVFIIDGEMVTVTQYHKSLAHFDSPKVIPRFLPPRVAQLMAMYFVYIRPLTDRWEAEQWALYGKTKPPSDFIWHDENGPWDGTRISKAMAKWSYHYMGRRITLQDWRHIAIAISKKHARQRGVAKADFEEDDNDDDEAERYEIPDDLAAAHTTKTAANYGVTIDVLRRLTAESLEVFGQVSHRWHKFLELDQPSSGRRPSPLEREAEADIKPQAPRPSKRARVMHLEKPRLGSGQDQVILKALQAVLRDDHARFRTPQQEEAVRMAAAKETPLVAILPTGGGKSLVFMVPAMLAGAGVTIVVAPYAELKRQLVTRCLDAGIDCKHWPQARDSWPRVVIVSAEAATGDDFMQWAADLSVRGRLDRVVIDECHLTFTAASEYRKKLQGLVRLRSLGCPFVFLTGTLPPLAQRDFEEAMQLQHPLYIRASSHRTSAHYSVLRVRNGRGPMEVKKLVEARVGLLAPGEKGVVYCTSHAKCKALARLMDCHYYHGDPNEGGDAHFLAQRESGFQAWLRGETPYIVATAALGTGIDVPGITHVIHLEAPHSIIDYAQEAGRAGRAGERVAAVIVVEEKDWPSEDLRTDGRFEMKVREVNSLIRTKGCRRRVLGQCLDNDTRDCDRIDDAVPCDNCQQQQMVWKSELSAQGIIASAAYGRRAARGMERMEAALNEVLELGKEACRICWMFKGAKAATHSWHNCGQLEETLTFEGCMKFQCRVDYRKDAQAKFLSCFYCHVSQVLCPDGYQTRGSKCQWKHVVIPVAFAACHDKGLWVRVQEELAGRELCGQQEYISWLG
ncbi:recq family helicase, partial [Trichoderma arundinaceum]